MPSRIFEHEDRIKKPVNNRKQCQRRRRRRPQGQKKAVRMPNWLGHGNSSRTELKEQIAEDVKAYNNLPYDQGSTVDQSIIELGHENSKKGWWLK